MAATVGQPAPDFTLYTIEARPWKLSDHLGAPVVLYFFPGAFSGVCTSEVNFVNNSLEQYRAAGATVAAISTDSTIVLAEFSRVNGLNFPLLSDHNAAVAADYGAKYNDDFTHMKLGRIAKRSAFVIDSAGVVQYAEVLDDADDEPDYAAALDALRSQADVRLAV